MLNITHSDFGNVPSDFLLANGNLPNGDGTTANGGFAFIDDDAMFVGISISPRASDTGNFTPTQSSFSSIDGGHINTMLNSYVVPIGTQQIADGSNSDNVNRASVVDNLVIGAHGMSLAQALAAGAFVTESIRESAPGVNLYSEQWQLVTNASSASGVGFVNVFNHSIPGQTDGHTDPGHHSDQNSWSSSFGTNNTGERTETIEVTVSLAGVSDIITDQLHYVSGHFHP